ncbi:MAG: hypothetical protein HZB30_01430 [Nitrospirae bacterium]|nr:hypothetical protein [Nitrospirota bacterium]
MIEILESRLRCHSREGGNPELKRIDSRLRTAGMTDTRIAGITKKNA